MITQQEMERRRAQLRLLEEKDAWQDLRTAAVQKSRRAAVEELNAVGEQQKAAARNMAAMGTPAHTRQLHLVRGAMATAGNNLQAYRFFENVYNRLQGRQVGGQRQQAARTGHNQGGMNK